MSSEKLESAEPVAWIVFCETEKLPKFVFTEPSPEYCTKHRLNVKPLYTTPTSLAAAVALAVERCAKDERRQAMDAILDGCPNDGSDTELILRRAWERVRTMPSRYIQSE